MQASIAEAPPLMGQSLHAIAQIHMSGERLAPTLVIKSGALLEGEADRKRRWTVLAINDPRC